MLLGTKNRRTVRPENRDPAARPSGFANSLFALESRYLFDAAGAATGAEAAADAVAQEQAEAAFTDKNGSVDSPLADGATVPAVSNNSDDLLAALATTEPPSAGLEIVFIDSTVEDYQTLMAGIKNPGALVVMLNGEQDGVEQIAEVLSQYENVDSVHVVAHGNAGHLRLGNTILTADSMQEEHRDELQIIGKSLSQNGDILVYGCNFGQGESGREAAQQFAALTGADIAASDDVTGHASLGGDWELEYQVGSIETGIVIDEVTQNRFEQTLDEVQLFTEFEGNFDYTVTGGSFRTEIDSVDPTALASTSPGDLALPTDATVTAAYLYWAGSDNLTDGQAADFTVTLTDANGLANSVDATRTFSASGDGDEGYFSGFADVTNIVASTGAGVYTLSDLTVNADAPHSNIATVMATWGLVVVYDAPSITTPSQIQIYDGLELLLDSDGFSASNTFTVSGLTVDASPSAQITTFVWEGDTRSAGGEGIEVNGTLLSAGGDIGNAWDSSSNEAGVNNGETRFGADIDTFDISSELGQGDTSFDVRVTTESTGDNLDLIHVNTLVVKVDLNADPDAKDDTVGALDDLVTISEDDSAIDITAAVLANDTDINTADVLSVIALNAPGTTGVVNLEGGVLTYDPNGQFEALAEGETTTDATFTYTVSDGNGGTDTATVTVTINGVNDPPTLDLDGDDSSGVVDADYAATFTEGSGGVSIADDVAIEDIDDTEIESAVITLTNAQADDELLVDTALLSPFGITLDASSTATQLVLIGPATLGNYQNAIAAVNFNNSGSNPGTSDRIIEVVVYDGNDDSNMAVSTISVDAIPAATDDAFTTDEDVPIDGNVLADNGTGADDQGDSPATVALGTSPSNGALDLGADGQFTYTPDTDFTGTDTFTYVVTDTDGDTSAATVTIVVNSVNDTPTAQDDSASTPEDTPVTIDVLGNDSDPDGDPLTVTEATDPANGTVAINTNGTVDYTPDPDFNGAESFTYKVSDGNGGTDTATVTVIVTPMDDGPAAADDATTTPEDTPITIDIVANDSDPDSDPLMVTGTSDPANGTVLINLDGTVDYTPDPDFNGTDTFTYTVSDGRGGTDTATVTVVVTPVADAPVAEDDASTTPEDMPITIDILANDSDPDDDALTVTNTTDPANGTVVINPDGTAEYTPGLDFNGTDTFTYTVSDGTGGTDTATVTVIVTPSDDTPMVADDVTTTPEDTAVTIDVLENDNLTDPNVTVTVGPGDGPNNGTVTVNPDGTVEYTPDSDFNGTDSFTYTVTTPSGVTEQAIVSVTVTPVDDAQPDTTTTDQDTPVTIDVLENDDFSDLGITVTVEPGDEPGTGTVTINPDGTIEYTPAPGFIGTDTFTYTVTTLDGRTETALVTVKVVEQITPSPDILLELSADPDEEEEEMKPVPADQSQFILLQKRLGLFESRLRLIKAVQKMLELSPVDREAEGRLAHPITDEVDRSREQLRFSEILDERIELSQADIKQSMQSAITNDLMVQTYLLGRVLYIQFEHNDGLIRRNDVTEYRVQAPEWLSVDPGGVLIGLPPADVDRVEIEIEAILRNGEAVKGNFAIEPTTGRLLEIEAPRTTAQVPGVETFSTQLALAAEQFDVEAQKLAAAFTGS